jgi:hypothetical protein
MLCISNDVLSFPHAHNSLADEMSARYLTYEPSNLIAGPIPPPLPPVLVRVHIFLGQSTIISFHSALASYVAGPAAAGAENAEEITQVAGIPGEGCTVQGEAATE